jgi:beta-glucosidase
VLRPVHELKAFAKVDLAPGESRTLTFALDARDLSYWHPGLRRWVVGGGRTVVEVGASSRDIRGTAEVAVTGEPLWGRLSAADTLTEWLAHPVGAPIVQARLDGVELDPMMVPMMGEMPMRVLAGFGMAGFDTAELEAMVAQAAA